MALYLIRHGETVWNREHRFQGALDSPLTEHGRDQARRYGLALRRLLGATVPALVASPLGRAAATMHLACTAASWATAACRLDPDLRELSFGAYDGLTRDEIPGFATIETAQAPGDSFFFHCPGGGSWDGLAARIGRAWARLDPARDTIVVLHSMSGKVLRGRCLGLDRAAILALDWPPDAIYRIAEGRETRLTAALDVAA
jgi:broad specificity phosphatase PhoE